MSNIFENRIIIVILLNLYLVPRISYRDENWRIGAGIYIWTTQPGECEVYHLFWLWFWFGEFALIPSPRIEHA